MREKELVCIGCPLGCSLKVTIQDDSTMEVTGNTCPRGADYARKELTDPRRIVTSSVPVEGGHLPCVSVKTESDIPKIDKIEKLITTLRDVLTQSTVDGCIVIESHDVDELIKLYNKIVVDDHIVKLK